MKNNELLTMKSSVEQAAPTLNTSGSAHQPITLPGHSFPYWSDPEESQTPPALIIGAGFSARQVLLPGELTIQYAAQQIEIERKLDISTKFIFKRNEKGTANNTNDLYCWAGKCIEAIASKDPGEEKETAKRQFINAIGLLEDPRFAATANVPLRGTFPRHRVIARLAREGCIFSIWSLNWDLWLEAAFEAVGLVRKESAHQDFSDELPKDWKKSYQVFLPSDRPDSSNNCIPLYKPHGCIGAFAAQTNDTFKITETELTEDVPKVVRDSLYAQINGKPVCAIGWGATEENLQNVFRECANAKQLKQGKLTIVGLKWNDGAPLAHSNLASRFEQDELSTLCAVQKTSPGTTDDLMLWIQALRTLCRFEKVVKALAPTNTDVLRQIETQLEIFENPICLSHPSGWALSWLDTFVPVWSRVCFSLKAQVFQNDADIPVNALPMMRRDEHIPLNDTSSKRWDILAAADLYAVLLGMELAMQRGFDFEAFPGAFWHVPTRTLLIPIPMWGNVADISLAAIKPLMESRHWNGMSRAKQICLLRVQGGPTDTEQPNDRNRLSVWKQGVCSLMKLRAFARADDIKDCDALELQAYLQSQKEKL